eukprot:GHVU01086932.1.p1 GENE.GHVU01086932.1~~GHVU01086932.1.p1  ORF type:complete len:151 (+),score=9.22 GHVU01086932.1:337-789(+)
MRATPDPSIQTRSRGSKPAAVAPTPTSQQPKHADRQTDRQTGKRSTTAWTTARLPPPTPTSVPGLSAADPGRQKRSGITEGDDWPWTAVGPTRRNSRWRTPMRWFDSANRILPESTHSNAGLSIGASGSPIALAQSEDGLSQSGSRASNR